MNSMAKTAVFVVVAVVLGGAAYLTRPTPPTLEYFGEVGEPFYPEFTDPLRAASLEVIGFDEQSGMANPFKVELRDGVWSIPSHHDYPADGEDRLANTAAGVIALKRDFKQSDRVQDHESLGVIDPLDDSTPTLQGRGQRVTLRDEGGVMLADFIVGKPVKGREGYRYVRVPGEKRTYGVKVEVDISTRFADWIETNLLKLTAADITSLRINDYSVDEQTGMVEMGDHVLLEKNAQNKWSMEGLPEAKQLDETRINQMATALSAIAITGVRAKPAGLSRDLTANQGVKLDLGTRMSLESKGFFVASDGTLLSNEGEVSVGSKQGVRYTLRFGEVIFGEGLEVTAGAEDTNSSGIEGDKPVGEVENRYLFVTAQYDEILLPPKPVAPPEYRAGWADEEAESEEAVAPSPSEAEDDFADVGGKPSVSSNGLPVPGEPAEELAEATKKAAEQRKQDFESYEHQLEEWGQNAADGRKLAAELNERFAPWYYVISATDFKNIRLDRGKLIKAEVDSAAD